MNRKIKNYVDVLFNDIPPTRKAAELKEEILADLNEHFEAHLAEGKSENQAYTEALGDMGDIDELLSSLAPEQELKPRIDKYRQRRAKNTAISVMLYILGVIFLTALPAISAVFALGIEDKMGVIGFCLMLVCVAVATGLLVYTKMSVPQDVAPFLEKKAKADFSVAGEKAPFWRAFFKLYWVVVSIIYLLISFTTGKWHITWIIWLIASAVRMAVILFCGLSPDDYED